MLCVDDAGLVEVVGNREIRTVFTREQRLVVATLFVRCRRFWRKVGIADKVLEYGCEIQVGRSDRRHGHPLDCHGFTIDALAEPVIVFDQDAVGLKLGSPVCKNVFHFQQPHAIAVIRQHIEGAVSQVLANHSLVIAL